MLQLCYKNWLGVYFAKKILHIVCVRNSKTKTDYYKNITKQLLFLSVIYNVLFYRHKSINMLQSPINKKIKYKGGTLNGDSYKSYGYIRQKNYI